MSAAQYGDLKAAVKYASHCLPACFLPHWWLTQSALSHWPHSSFFFLIWRITPPNSKSPSTLFIALPQATATTVVWMFLEKKEKKRKEDRSLNITWQKQSVYYPQKVSRNTCSLLSSCWKHDDKKFSSNGPLGKQINKFPSRNNMLDERRGPAHHMEQGE